MLWEAGKNPPNNQDSYSATVDLFGYNREPSVDLQRTILGLAENSVMYLLVQELTNHPVDSSLTNTLWETMMLMGFLREKDREIISHVFLKHEKHKICINTFAKFQMSESQKNNGSFWLGGLKVEQNSLSHEMVNRDMHKYPQWMKMMHKHLNTLIHGQCETVKIRIIEFWS